MVVRLKAVSRHQNWKRYTLFMSKRESELPKEFSLVVYMNRHFSSTVFTISANECGLKER